ncbi:MAG: formate/nitrite transporter family protein [Chloroflexi bacterium]|nr:formate/nitrite transporter family protein [Chloroflexota bacterium]
MVRETIVAFAAAAQKKGELLEASLPRYLILSTLAGAYIGLGIALIFAIGAPLAAVNSPFLKVVMGASFGVALTLVIFAGAELFTGNAMVITVGALSGQTRWGQLASLWLWSYAGNLAGSLAVALLLAQSGALGAEPQRSFVESVAAAKMALPFGAAFARGILANWLVCLALWCAARTTNDVAKLALIFWCLFAFIGTGFEHSIANMTLLGLALFQPHGDAVSWAGYGYNLVPVTLGNLVGGAVFVGALYWLSAPVRQPGPQPRAMPAAAGCDEPMAEPQRLRIADVQVDR